MVGALSLKDPRLESILECLWALFDVCPVDGIYAATSLGDLIGKGAGRPQEIIFTFIRNKLPFDCPIRIFSSACSSGSDALSMGYLAIQAKRADILLILAADSLCPAKLAHHIALGTQSPTRARPFDRNRDGTSFGEGGAFLILANARGVERLKKHPIAEVTGVGFSCDGYDITMPDPSGKWAACAISQCLKGQPNYINAHGTGTILNDLAEAKALHAAVDLSSCLISSTKGAIGHCLGAAGLIEAVICIKALQSGLAPPTAGLQQIDPALGLRPIQEGVHADLQTALSVTFGFGGVNSAISFRRAS